MFLNVWQNVRMVYKSQMKSVRISETVCTLLRLSIFSHALRQIFGAGQGQVCVLDAHDYRFC